MPIRGIPLQSLDDRFVNLTGDEMTGALLMGTDVEVRFGETTNFIRGNVGGFTIGSNAGFYGEISGEIYWQTGVSLTLEAGDEMFLTAVNGITLQNDTEVQGDMTANAFYGDGSNLTGIEGSKWSRTGTILMPATSGDSVETESKGRIVSDGALLARGMMNSSWGFNDLLAAGGLHTTPWAFANLGSGGTSLNIIYSKDHPGVMTHRTHASNTNSGAYMKTNNVFLLGGGEIAELCFYVVDSTDLLVYWGWHNTANQTAPTRAAYIDIAGTTITGKTINNTGNSTTGTSYTLSTGTWYRGIVEINSDVTLATFKIYSDAGVLLWSDTLSTNLPNYALNHMMGCNLVAVRTSSAGAITDFFAVDYTYYYIDRNLTR